MPSTGMIGTRREALRAMLEIHERRAMLCHALERLADGLPALPDAMTVTAITRQLMLFHDERKPLEAHLESVATAADPQLAAAVHHRLLADNTQDSYHASDLALELTEQQLTPLAGYADRLGFTLRCFFECCRRSSAMRALAALHALGQDCEPAVRGALLASLRDSP